MGKGNKGPKKPKQVQHPKPHQGAHAITRSQTHHHTTPAAVHNHPHPSHHPNVHHPVARTPGHPSPQMLINQGKRADADAVEMHKSITARLKADAEKIHEEHHTRTEETHYRDDLRKHNKVVGQFNHEVHQLDAQIEKLLNGKSGGKSFEQIEHEIKEAYNTYKF